jgi:integrase/recombinase XerC
MLEEMTTTQSLQLFLRALQGQNYSPKTLRAYGDDLAQFLGWVEKNRVDFDIPTRLSRADIEGFMQFLAAGRMTGVTRVRKLAAIRKFFTFLTENSILAGNPANTVKGARREDKEPNILFKEQYKALMVSYFNCTTGKVSHSVKDHTWSARPAAIAGVRFCHQPPV